MTAGNETLNEIRDGLSRILKHMDDPSTVAKTDKAEKNQTCDDDEQDDPSIKEASDE